MLCVFSRRSAAAALFVSFTLLHGAPSQAAADGGRVTIEPLASAAKVGPNRPQRGPRDVSPRQQEIRGVEYKPLPKRHSEHEAAFPSDFVMGTWLSGQWSWNGRDDLGVVKRLGANAILVKSRDPWHAHWDNGQEAGGNERTCSFKWFRFRPTAVRNGGTVVQLSELKLQRGESNVDLKGAIARTAGGFMDSPWEEEPLNVIDGALSTKWLSKGKEPLIIKLSSAVEVDSFSFVTANDEDGRDPVQWTLDASTDGKIWTALQVQAQDYQTPLQRGEATPRFSWTEDDCRRAKLHHFNTTAFLDTANQQSLKVIIGLPEHEFTSSQGACAATETMDCFDAARSSFANKLRNGLRVGSGSSAAYHPALDTIILMSEPERKILAKGSTAQRGSYMKAVVSAFDGMLAAEKEAGIYVPTATPRISTTFSYRHCPECPSFLKLKHMQCCVPCGDELGLPSCEELGEVGKLMRCDDSHRLPNFGDDCPVLAMLLDLHDAMKDPASVGYTPRRTTPPSLLDAYEARWVHTINIDGISLQNFEPQFLSKYAQLSFNRHRSVSDMVPIFISEFKPILPQDPDRFRQEVGIAVALARNVDNPFLGFNVAEFQVSYDEQCDEDRWAMYWNKEIALDPCPQRAFGLFAVGDLVLGSTGYVPSLQHAEPFTIGCLYSASPKKLQGLAELFGGTVPDTTICQHGARSHPQTYCVADRGAELEALNRTMKNLCSHLQGVLSPNAGVCSADGAAVGPAGAGCSDAYAQADWAFSAYFAKFAESHRTDLHELCDFKGMGVLSALPPRPECTVDPRSVSAFFQGEREQEYIAPGYDTVEDRTEGMVQHDSKHDSASFLDYRSKILLLIVALLFFCYWRRLRRIYMAKAMEPFVEPARERYVTHAPTLADAESYYIGDADSNTSTPQRKTFQTELWSAAAG